MHFGMRLCTITCLVFTWIAVPHMATAATIILDTFDDGDAEDGMPVTWVPGAGTWDASSGDYTVRGPALKESWVPEHILGDTSIRTRVRLSGEGLPGRGVSIQFRKQGGNFGNGYAGSLLANGTIGFARVQPFTILGAAIAPFEVLSQDVMLQIDAFGDELSLWAWPVGEPMPASPQVVVNDDTYTEGGVGVFSNETAGVSTFRFVHVADTHIPFLDFNIDGAVDTADIDSLAAKIVAETNDAPFDLTGEGVVDAADLMQWLSAAAARNGFSEAYLLGDSNLDGSVNAIDLNNLALSWRQDTTNWSGGNFIADSVVDSGDLNALALNWRQSIPMASAVNVPVPEPSALLLTLVGLALVWMRTRFVHLCSR